VAEGAYDSDDSISFDQFLSNIPVDIVIFQNFWERQLVSSDSDMEPAPAAGGRIKTNFSARQQQLEPLTLNFEL
jgi:hypothetical protein